MGPVYNPLIKRGKYRVSLGGHSITVTAGDVAEAKWKFAKKFGLDLNTHVADIQVEVISMPIRQNDRINPN